VVRGEESGEREEGRVAEGYDEYDVASEVAERWVFSRGGPEAGSVGGGRGGRGRRCGCVDIEVEGVCCDWVGVVRDGLEELLELFDEYRDDIVVADCDVAGVAVVNFESDTLLDRYDASVVDADADDAVDGVVFGAAKCDGRAEGGRFS
jgi:hypothetical protein